MIYLDKYIWANNSEIIVKQTPQEYEHSAVRQIMQRKTEGLSKFYMNGHNH